MTKKTTDSDKFNNAELLLDRIQQSQDREVTRVEIRSADNSERVTVSVTKNY